jgi:hypothetical protein
MEITGISRGDSTQGWPCLVQGYQALNEWFNRLSINQMGSGWSLVNVWNSVEVQPLVYL